MAEAKELKVKEKQEVEAPAEQTQPGLVFTPDVDIYETETAITMLADMPGVTADGIGIDLRDDVLTISGEVLPFGGEKENEILVEFEVGRYHRQFTLAETIDQSKIEANYADGVLHLNLPKQEKATPRKITVSAG